MWISFIGEKLEKAEIGGREKDWVAIFSPEPSSLVSIIKYNNPFVEIINLLSRFPCFFMLE
jgi:hypothetical protein